jgi:hypothetical protein
MPLPKRGPGRPKGASNKITRDIKEAILAAFDKVGGADYLARQADENPTAFMTLLGKVLPTQISNADGEGPFVIEVVKRGGTD